jgi:hypothetical protein
MNASAARPLAPAGSRPAIVAAVAACVPPVWIVALQVFEALPAVLLMVPASALSWFCVALHLQAVDAAGKRLALAAGYGLVSPVLGWAVAAFPTMCVPCGLTWLAVAAAPAMMIFRPLSFWPVGVGMGLVAFAIVSIGRGPSARAA